MRSILALGLLHLALAAAAEARPVVMLTGYWAPTSEMIVRFSDDPDLNPEGWIGRNWEGFGYDVHAFFPAFNKDSREFEVDYQATWHDFWARTDEFHPQIIISFGATGGLLDWVIEDDAFNLDSWFPDDHPPYYPTPNPPDSTLAVGAARFSTLPMRDIRDAVNAQTDVSAMINVTGNPGNFLCNYIAYLGMWYQSLHAWPGDEHFCKAAGFIHVDQYLPLPDAREAALVTLRTTLEVIGDVTGVGDPVAASAAAPTLTNSPNPFNPRTTITCAIPAAGHARLQVVDLRGRLVATLVDEPVPGGALAVSWDGRDRTGGEVPSGVYVSRLEVGGQVVLGRMTLLR